MSADDSDHPAPPLRIVAGTVLVPPGTGSERLIPAELQLARGRVQHLDPSAVGPRTHQAGPLFDADGLVVVPGLIDLQINGGHGHDLWAHPEAMWALADDLPRHGVTAFYPTIISGPPDRAEAAMTALARRPRRHRGAEPLGLHLEGPVLASARAGAHDPHHLVAPEQADTTRWTREDGVHLVTLAPELEGAHALIRQLRSAGVMVAAGHSDATASQAAAAREAGIGLVTHLFNAMTPLHHRQPGLAGWALGSIDQPFVSLIVDGIHVDPTMVAMAYRALGPQNLVLVSDAVAAMGLPPGCHRLGGRTVVADGTGVRRADGTLAGSALTLDRAVANLMAATGCGLAEAVDCATITPATAIGATGSRGRIQPGAMADLTIVDRDVGVVATICRGEVAHLAPGAQDRLSGAGEPRPGPG